MPAENWMRAGDWDREATVEILREAYAEGRLDTAELSEREDSAFRARTIGELRGLIADVLPRGWVRCLPSDQSWEPGSYRRSAGTHGLSSRASLLILLGLVAALAFVMIGAATHGTAVMAVGLPTAFGALSCALAGRRAGPSP